MKTLNKIKKFTIIVLVILCMKTVSFGASFTAVTSGNWDDAATWGTASTTMATPAFTVTGDQISVPSGITVTMDGNVTLDGTLSTLAVAGKLSGSSSTYLTINTGTLSGAGTIATGWVNFGTTAFLTFSGSITADYYSNSAALTLKSYSNLVVNKSMALTTGILSIESGGTLTMNSNASFLMSGGTLVSNGGTLTLSSNYNVVYSSAATTGAELTGSGLNNVTVNVNSNASIALNSNVNVNILTLTSGRLVLNNHNLTITGDLQTSENASISSTPSSNITINTSNSPTGNIAFSANGNAVNNLTINIANGGALSFGSNSNLTVAGTLTLTKGNLNIGNNTLTIGSSGSVSGGGNSSYIITGTSGYLAMSLTAGASGGSTFHVGTSSNYFPAMAQLNSGSANGTIAVNVKDNVYAHGTTGNMLSTTQPMVNATWDFTSNISSNMNTKMTLIWSASAEVNAFDRTRAFIAHYTNSQWDVTAAASATAQGSGMYAITRDNITSFSPFAVFDQSTAGIDNSIGNVNGNLNLFPNPADNSIFISDINKNTYFEITNTSGRLFGSGSINGNNQAIDISQLATGCYFIRLYNQNSSVVRKFIKI